MPQKNLQNIKKRKNPKNLFLVLAILPKGRHRFANKKMRRLSTAFICILIATGARCQRRSAVGVDLSRAVCFGTADITLCHKIGSRWSIEGQTAISIKRVSDEKDEETIQHWNALADTVYKNGEKIFRDDLTELSLSVSFWPREVFSGPVLSIGGIIRDRTGPDIFCKIGYSVNIWKGLYTDIGFRICIMETIRYEKLQYNGIRIGLSYAF